MRWLGGTVALAAALLAVPAAQGAVDPGRGIGGVAVGGPAPAGGELVRAAGEVRVVALGDLEVTVAGRGGRLRVLRVATEASGQRTPGDVGVGATLDEVVDREPDARCGSSSGETRTCVLAGTRADTVFELVLDRVARVVVELLPERRAARCGAVGYGEPGEPSFGPADILARETTCTVARAVARASRAAGQTYVARGFRCRTLPGRGITRVRCTRRGTADRYEAEVRFSIPPP
jgi:hypothetical protein